MNKDKLLLLTPSNNLKFEQQKACTVSDLVEVVKKHYEGLDINALKLDVGFLKHVCCLVETGIKKNKSGKYKLDKKQIVITALQQLIPTLSSPEMISIIDKNIESLHDEGLIVPLKESSYMISSVSKWLVKKIIWLGGNYIENSLQNILRINTPQVNQIIVSNILLQIGIKKSIVIIVLLFL